MSKGHGNHTGRFVWLCIGVFILVFAASAVFKLKYQPKALRTDVHWDASVGTVHHDLVYGPKPANKFDLYLPATKHQHYGLIVYLHAGGFTSGDKRDDASILKWLCAKGYVTVGINYTLFSKHNPNATVATQSEEIKASIPVIIHAAAKYGYAINQMALSGGSAGGALALLYAYRDAKTAPVPVKMVFEGVGPSSFYPQDWTNFGFDKNHAAAAKMFTQMSGRHIKASDFGTAAYARKIKQISALAWVSDHTVPTVMAYGKYDKMQSFLASKRLAAALTKHHVPHDYIVFPHSGHGLQNDNKQAIEYNRAIDRYLKKYLPVQ